MAPNSYLHFITSFSDVQKHGKVIIFKGKEKYTEKNNNKIYIQKINQDSEEKWISRGVLVEVEHT